MGSEEASKHLPEPVWHQWKVTEIVWWSAASSLSTTAFWLRAKTITAVKHCEELDKLHQKLHRIYLAFLNRKELMLLHDNAQPHVSLMTTGKLIGPGYQFHPPISPDLPPTSWHLFNHHDIFLHKKCFQWGAFDYFVASRTPDFEAAGTPNLVSQ